MSRKVLKVGEEQSGFRKGRSGLENVLVIKEIIEQNKKVMKGIVLTSSILRHGKRFMAG